MSKRKKKAKSYEPIIYGIHQHSSAIIFLSLAAVVAHKKVILPKR